MEDIPDKIGLGLLPLPKDKRYFKITKLLGSIDLTELPEEFIVADPKVKNQGHTLWCVAYTATTASEPQEGVELSPLYQAAKIAQIRGQDYLKGATLKDGAKSLIKFGSLKQEDAPTNLKDNPKDWPEECEIMAEEHRKKSYFMADGYEDTFTAIKAALWQNRAKKCLIMSGADWRPSWTTIKEGIIQDKYESSKYPHAFVIIGWKYDYLILHLSNSTAFGDKGRWYMPRAVANKELKYGNLLLVDISPYKAKKICWSFWQKAWAFIKENWRALKQMFN